MPVSRHFVFRTRGLRVVFARVANSLVVLSLALTGFTGPAVASPAPIPLQQTSQPPVGTPTAQPTTGATPGGTETATTIATATDAATVHTPTASPTLSDTVTPRPSDTASPTPSETVTVAATLSATVTPTETITPTSTVTATGTVTPTSTVSPTVTVTPTVRITPIATITATPTVTGTIPPPPPGLDPLIPSDLPRITAQRDLITGIETASINPDGAAALFMGGRVAVVARDGVFRAPVRLQLSAQPVLTLTQQVFSTTVGMQFGGSSLSNAPLRFTLEALDHAGRSIEKFEQNVQIFFDMRALDPTSSAHNWYVAYQDPADPALWYRVPVTAHERTGLISIETDHFSSWAAGNEPGAWHYRWSPPTVSTFSGAATYSYPIAVPPGRGGLAPDVTLSYSSRGLDGLVLPNHDQGPLGLGWSMSQIEIMRNGVHHRCCDNLPIHPNDFTLTINGTGYRLRTAGALDWQANNVRYYAINGPQLHIERIYNPAATYNVNDPLSINKDKFYWQVRTPDGTLYRLGYTREAEGYQTTVTAGGHNGADPSYSGIRWRVDRITDLSGNRLEYRYAMWDQDDSYWNGNNVVGFTTAMRQISEIRYNFDNSSPDSHKSRVEFLYDGSHRLNTIKLYHITTSPYRQFAIVQDTAGQDICGQNTWTNRVLSITEKNGDGTVSLPATTLSYQLLAHHDNGCYPYHYLSQYNNGQGGQVQFTYQDDTHKGEYCNGECIPPFGLSYFVTRVETSDGDPVTANAITDYAYYKPCYDQESGEVGQMPGAFNCLAGPGVEGAPYPGGALSGFETVTVTVKEGVSSELAKTVYKFHQAQPNMGQPYRQQSLNPGTGAVLQQTDTLYASVPMTATTFTYASVVTNTIYSGASSAASITKYFYETSQQGGAQYGNLTRVEEYDAPGHLLRCTRSGFYPNTTQWIVNKPAYENVYSPCTWSLSDVVSAVGYVYNTASTPSTASPPDSLGRLRAVRRWDGNQVAPYGYVYERFTYHTWGDLATTSTYTTLGTDSTYPIGAARTTTTTYDSQYHLYPSSITNPLNQTTNLGYDLVLGVPLTVTDPNVQATHYRYDALGRLTQVYRPGDTLVSNLPTIRYSYTDAYSSNGLLGLKVQEDYRETSGDASAFRPIVKIYNGLGQLVQERAETQNGSQMAVTNYMYDAAGRLQTSYVPAFENGTGAGFWEFNRPAGWDTRPKTTTAYDALGRVINVTAPDGTTTQSSYGLDTVTQYGITQTTGLPLQSMIDAAGHFKQQVTDNAGRMVLVREFLGNAPGNYALYATTRYGYDNADRLVVVTDTLGTVTTIEYNQLGQKIGMVDPDMGDWRYTYDVSGNLETQTDNKGQVLSFSYDALNRLIEKHQTAPTNTWLASYTYGASAPNIGHRVRMVDPASLTQWGYDPRGRVISETKIITGTGTYTTLFAYDAMDRPITTTLPTGEVITQTYNAQGLLENVRSQTHSQWYVPNLDYDAAGRTELLAYGNGLQTDYVYFPWDTFKGQGRLSQIQTGSPQFPRELQYLSYGYTEDGNLSSVLDYAQNRAQAVLSAGNGYSSTYLSGRLEGGQTRGRVWADFNGDAMADYCTLVGTVAGQSSRVACTISTGTGFGASYQSGIVDWGYDPGRAWADFNGDGKADFCRVVGGVQAAYVACTVSTGTGFGSGYQSGAIDWGYNSGRAWVDFNGDGKADYCRVVGSVNLQSSYVTCTVSTGTGFGATYSSGVIDWGQDAGRHWADFNGDGKADYCRLIGASNPGSVACTLSTGTGFGATYTSGSLDRGQTAHQGWVDFNGDNKADFCRPVGAGSTTSVACTLSTGTGFGATYTSATLDWGFADGRAWADFNGDGKADYCRTVGSYNYVSSYVACTLSSGTGWGNTHTSGLVNWGQTTGRAWADFNGDGKADYLSLTDTPQWYSYDSLDRVTSSSTALSGGYTVHYSYQKNGNLATKTEGGPAVTYNYPPASSPRPHAVTSLTNGATFTYDANGNMLQRVTVTAGQFITHTQGWDAENRLAVVTDTTTGRVTSFVYDADGARIKQVEQLGAVITTTVYVGPVEITIGTTWVTRTHYYAGSQLVATREVSGGTHKLYFLASDHLGSTSVATCGNSACGAVTGLVARQYYYPYGSERPIGLGTLPTDHTYTGQIADGTGLMYYNARYYDPYLNQFISADTIVPGPGNPQAFNRYSYALSNPIRYTDPSGHAVACASDVGTGCEGFGPSTILDSYLDDPVAQENALQDFISTHANYNPYNDPLLDDTAKVMVVNTSFRVRANDPEQYGWQVASYGVAAAAAAMAYQGESGRQLAFPLFQGNAPLTNQAHVPAPANGNFYTVAYEVELPRSVWSQRSRTLHNQAANRTLALAIDSDPNFAASMNTLVPDVRNQIAASPGQSPAGWTWHHDAYRTGIMQLVPRFQHEAGYLQHLFHPGGAGGYARWR